jgi:hypothetical protein
MARWLKRGNIERARGVAHARGAAATAASDDEGLR